MIERYHIIQKQIEEYVDSTGNADGIVNLDSILKIKRSFSLILCSDLWGALMHWDFKLYDDVTPGAFGRKEFRLLYSALKYFCPENNEDAYNPVMFRFAFIDTLTLDIVNILPATAEAAVMISSLLGEPVDSRENFFDYDLELDYDE